MVVVVCIPRMRPRSASWKTVYVPAKQFRLIAQKADRSRLFSTIVRPHLDEDLGADSDEWCPPIPREESHLFRLKRAT